MKKRWLLSIPVLLALSGAWWATRPAPRARMVSSSTVSTARLSWSVGSRYEYSMRWSNASVVRGVTAVTAPGAQDESEYKGELDLDATLRIRVLGRDADVYTVAVSLPEIRKLRLMLLGQDVFQDPATREQILGDREIFAQIDSQGHVVKMFVDPNAHPAFKDIMQSVVSTLQVPLPAQASDESWQATSRSALGEARLDTKLNSDRAGVSWNHIGYNAFEGIPERARKGTDLDDAGHGSALVAKEGHLAHLDDQQHTQVRRDGTSMGDFTSKLSLDFVSVARDTSQGVPDLAMLEHREAGERSASNDSPEQRDRQLARGIDEGSIRALFVSYEASKKLPPGMLRRTAAYLRLHPEMCGELLARFQQPSSSTIAKAFTLDLLAAAGSKEAQAAMRSALSSGSASDTKLAPVFLQRFALVKQPTPETVAFVSERFADAKKNMSVAEKQAAAQSLGSLGRHLFKQRDMGQAGQIEKQLLSELKNASSAEDRAMMVAAVGNLARAENVPVLVRYSADASESVRTNAATALGDVRTPEAMNALLDLTADPSAQVSGVAIAALAHGNIDAHLLADVEARVIAGKTNPDSDAALIATFSPQLTPGGPVERMFRAMLARAPEDSRIAGTLHAALEQLPQPQ